MGCSTSPSRRLRSSLAAAVRRSTCGGGQHAFGAQDNDHHHLITMQRFWLLGSTRRIAKHRCFKVQWGLIQVAGKERCEDSERNWQGSCLHVATNGRSGGLGGHRHAIVLLVDAGQWANHDTGQVAKVRCSAGTGNNKQASKLAMVYFQEPIVRIVQGYANDIMPQLALQIRQASRRRARLAAYEHWVRSSCSCATVAARVAAWRRNGHNCINFALVDDTTQLLSASCMTRAKAGSKLARQGSAKPRGADRYPPSISLCIFNKSRSTTRKWPANLVASLNMASLRALDVGLNCLLVVRPHFCITCTRRKTLNISFHLLSIADTNKGDARPSRSLLLLVAALWPAWCPDKTFQ